MNLFRQNDYTDDDINLLVSTHAEENIHLEFKAAGALQNNDSAKKELAKDVSAFANSDGGIIIFGINESNHTASGISFIDGNSFTKEWLEQIIDSRIQKKIQGLTIYPIRFHGEIGKTVYIIKIPRSYDAPHMADNRYFKRYNFKSQPMEEYEVRDLFNRKNRSKLTIIDPIIGRGMCQRRLENFSRIRYSMIFQVSNIGNVVEHDYKNEFYIPTSCFDNANPTYQKLLKRKEAKISVLSIPCESPIFQDEIASVANLQIVLNSESFADLIEYPATQKLYYSEGIEHKKFDFSVLDVSYETEVGEVTKKANQINFV